VKYNKKNIFSRVYKIHQIRFEDQKLTSFSGLIIFQILQVKVRWPLKIGQCDKL
jgi:hypothetical protein